MKIIDGQLLDRLTELARQGPRLRMNHNLHDSYDEPCQRLLNAVEPGSYTRPHRHTSPSKPECFLLVRGRLVVLVFGENGGIEKMILLSSMEGTLGVEIPAGVWHSIVSLESGSIFFETKPGPYMPLADKDFATWAPAEGSAEASHYLETLLHEIDNLF